MRTIRWIHPFLIVAASWSPLAAQAGGTPPEVTVAQSALRAGDPDSAIRTLEGFFQRSPNAVLGRLLLGNAYRQTGALDKALATYLAISQPRPMRIQANFLAAGIHAVQGNTSEAFRLLTQLKASGAFDMDLVRTTPDFKSLLSDPRLASVLFEPGDFVNPFVEPVRILHEWVGETKGDQFSWIARDIGDADGDKVHDLVTSAPTFGAGTGPTGPGKVYVYSGRTGALLWSHAGAGTEGLGSGLEGAGDVNRDGIPDVIAGAPGASRAYVYSGREGKLLLTLVADSSSEGFGGSASGAGDQNGDGYADLIVGAPSANVAGQGAGRAYIFSGKDGSRLRVIEGERAGDAFGSIVAGAKGRRSTPVLVGAPGSGPGNRGRVYVFEGSAPRAKFVIDADTTGAALGAMFASVVGDVDGDKVPDVYAADFTNSAKGPSTGRIYVHSGADGHRLLSLTGEGPGDGFGIGSADVGDVNRDGHDDLLVGAWQFSSAAPSGGKAYLYSGKDGTLIRAITGRIPGETLGFDATGIGDVDGDGTPDLLLTSSWSNINGFRSGRMFVISGAQSKCAASPEYRQMDFWIGTWYTAPWSAPAETRVSRNVIQPLLDGCLLLENFSGAGYEGKSFNYFDPNLKTWRQLWVDQAGIISDVVGGLRDGKIQLIGEGFNPRGVKITRRMTLFPVAADTVHQIWETSADGGSTWTKVVDMRYTRTQPAP